STFSSADIRSSAMHGGPSGNLSSPAVLEGLVSSTVTSALWWPSERNSRAKAIWLAAKAAKPLSHPSGLFVLYRPRSSKVLLLLAIFLARCRDWSPSWMDTHPARRRRVYLPS